MNTHSAQRDTENSYTATVYLAAPGTPIANPKTGEIDGKSLPGHMYYMISDGFEKQGYGFAPKDHGSPLGAGQVYDRDFESYQDPYYARTVEITREQYEKLKEYGDAGAKGQETYFDLYYNGATNSCIDFTWGALNHAGLHQQLGLPNSQSMPLRNADGQVMPLSNIAALESIPSPFPKSLLNDVDRNPAPDGWVEKAGQAKASALEHVQGKVQDVLNDIKCEAFPKLPDCPPDGASLDQKRALPDPRDPTSPGHRMYGQIEAGVARLDAEHGRSFDTTSERLTMSAYVDAHAARVTSADHIAFNNTGTPQKDGSQVCAATLLCIVQGPNSSDVVAPRSITEVRPALERPVEQALMQLGTQTQQQAQRLAQQPTAPTQDDPGRGPRMA